MKANKNGVGRSLVEYAVIFLLVAIITVALLCVLALLLVNATTTGTGIWLINSWETIKTAGFSIIGGGIVVILIFTAIGSVLSFLFGGAE